MSMDAIIEPDRTAERGSTNNRQAIVSVDALARLSRYFLYYSLVFVLVYIGGMKFTAYEAEGISGLVENSPVLA